jgi:5-methylcytosine-specific restriction endonuclease McrA
MIDAGARAAVAERANDRCEYCLLPHADHCWPFHVEHIVPRQHGGSDSLDNLAYACARCNRYKGPNLTAIDPATGRITPLFHPRIHSWADHFAVADDEIVGTTDIGRATARLLRMNAENRRDLRRELG